MTDVNIIFSENMNGENNPCTSAFHGSKDKEIKRSTDDPHQSDLDRKKIMKHSESDPGSILQPSPANKEETPTRNPCGSGHGRVLDMNQDQRVGSFPTLEDSLSEELVGEIDQPEPLLDQNEEQLVPEVNNPHPPEGVDVMVSISKQVLVWQRQQMQAIESIPA